MDDVDGAGLAGGEGLGVGADQGGDAAAEAAPEGAVAGGAVGPRRPLDGGPGITGWRGRDARSPAQWYGPEAEDAIVARVAEGETLASVCGEAGMPSLNTALAWLKRRAGFAARVEAAKRAAGRRWEAPKTPFCAETVGEIVGRLCEGEGLVAICADPAMPNVRTVVRWMAKRADLREAVTLAREIQGERIAELGLAEAMAATPQTARAVEVRLRHLRWHAAKVAPVKYGAHKAEAAPKPEAPMQVTLRTFWLETRDDGWRRVRASYADGKKRIVEEPPGAWERPPPNWRPQLGDRQAGGAAAGRTHAPAPDDPEGWR